MAEPQPPPNRRKRRRDDNPSGSTHSPPTSSDGGPSRGRRTKRRHCMVAPPPSFVELTRGPLVVSTHDRGDREGSLLGVSDTEEESVVVVPGVVESERGGVVDLTNDSGVEDEDIVDLTSPIELRIPHIVPEHEFLGHRPSCRFASHHSGRGQGAEVVVVQESDDEVQVISSAPAGWVEMVSIHSSTLQSKRIAKAKSKKSERKLPTPQLQSPPSPAPKSSLKCPICMDTASQFESSGRTLVTTICGHIFCNSCIRNAIQRQHKCPTCRKKLSLKQYHLLFL